MGYQLVKRKFIFIASLLKYRVYKIDNFEKMGKIEIFETKCSLLVANRDFLELLCDIS